MPFHDMKSCKIETAHYMAEVPLAFLHLPRVSWRQTFEASRNKVATGTGKLTSFFGSSVYFLPFPLQKFETSRAFG